MPAAKTDTPVRALANGEPAAFSPPGLTREIARCEGWTFGVL
ncbi:hypothetical protein [Sphingomonas sp.]|nr:hypothetical protein [Sphingomonas sp.]